MSIEEEWIDPAELEARSERSELDAALVSTVVVISLFILLAFIFGELPPPQKQPANSPEYSKQLAIEWNEPVFMPRHPDCIDAGNGQLLPQYGIGYEPSLSMDSQGNLFITAHKDLAWGGQGSPVWPVAGEQPGLWYACSDGDDTSWDYFASWWWQSQDGGETWGWSDNFGPTPGSMLEGTLLGGVTGSACLGDEGDISVDAQDRIYFLDTTLQDNFWHTWDDGGDDYANDGPCQQMYTSALDDRPWLAAQGDGIIHYLGNSGAPPPECTGDSGRYWYYHSENGGPPFTQCYAMPGGWSTIVAQRTGPYVYVAQEDADTSQGTVIIRISDEYGRGTGLTDGTWQDPVTLGERKGNPPEGYPVVNTNERGTVAVVWADAPNGATGAWEMNLAISYDHGAQWQSWNITPFENGINMYPFVSISENDVVSVAFYGIDFDDDELEGDYVAGEEWFLYAGAVHRPMENDSFEFSIADMADWDDDGLADPLHTVTAYEQENSDVHALHDFFETVISPNGTYLGIAYQQNIALHPFEAEEEQRYIKFVSGSIDPAFSASSSDLAGGEFGSESTCDGVDLSPSIQWHNAPEGTVGFALAIRDVDADDFKHWTVWNIPVDAPGFVTGAYPDGDEYLERSVQGENGFGDVGYGGPCPPEGETHTYLLTVYALDAKLSEGTDAQFLSHAIAISSISATYSR